MLFPIIAALSIVVLRLQTRWRWRTILWVSVVLGLAADSTADLLVTMRR